MKSRGPRQVPAAAETRGTASVLPRPSRIPDAADPDTGAGPAGWLPIGELARRSGVAASALRFYEEQGLIHGARSAGGRRRYPRHVLRRVAFIRAAQQVGLSLEQVRDTLSGLPDARTPTKADWARLARDWQPLIDERLRALQALRDRLVSCIGCGCLSLKTCALYNPGDRAAALGSGAGYLERAARGEAALPDEPD